PLEKLDAARDAAKSAAGSPAQLNKALRQAEFVFEEITNTPGHRNPGATYGARTILYEDCRRGVDLRVAPELLQPIVPALSLLLKSLRWFMQSMAQEFCRLFHETHRELAAQSPERKIRLLDWWLYTEPKLLDAPSVNEIEKLFKQRWAGILPAGSDDSVLQFESSALKKAADELFPVPGTGYYPVRYFCPDLMLAAKDVESIQRGELLYVLGEIHSGKNTLCHAALVEQHPDVQGLVAATEWDLSGACFKIITPQEVETTTARTSEAALRPGDFLVATTADSIAPSGHDSHPVGDLALQEQDRELYAVSHSSGRRFHILEAFSDVLFGFVMNKASWVQPARHVPRVLIDKLVIHRESWRFRKDELTFALEKDEAKRFLGARKWMATHKVPLKAFVRSASEVKPFYLDMDTPVLVEGLCRAIHQLGSPTEEISFSEMLPTSEQLWLRDAEGNLYTSELRFAVVDIQARTWSESQRKAR
ncbi:MAG TPA: hypothetical protein VE133_11685, partial [Candidatus Sulfotelmatobacter sp.]|nr:hypothetical protein [Candidatus Sulfotelmatobacter sp.]